MPFRNVYWLWLTAAVMIVDQISKQLVVKHLDLYELRPVLPHVNLVHATNTGAAFSLFSEAPALIFVALALAVSVFVLWWMRKNAAGQTFAAIGLALIMGGALGNAIDRVMRGHVVDFVDFYVGDWHFAAFNVADAAISIGAACMIVDLLVQTRLERAKAREE